MVRTKRLWTPLLVAVLVAGVLGVGGGGVTAVEPRVATSSIMIPAGAFIPTEDDNDYISNGIHLSMESGTGRFTAPVLVPVPVVNIKRITLYAYDNDATDTLCVYMYRSAPGIADEVRMGEVCTLAGVATIDPQAPSTTAISPRSVNTTIHGPYLWAVLNGPGVELYGVKITYSYETG